MLTTIPPTLHSPGGRQTPAPGSPQHTLAAASASLPRRPVSRRLCAAAAGAPSSHAAPQARQRHAVAGNPPAPPPQGGAPAALRPSGPSLPAAARQRLPALTPGGQRGARSFQHPAGQSPTPPGAGRGHFPRRQGDTGPTCLHAAGPSRAHEPTQAATGGRRVGGRPAGRQIRLWSGKAVGSPRRPSLRRGDRAPADDKGLRLERCTGRGGRRELGRAPPSAAPWRLAQRRREETKGPWGPGGRTESDRGHQKGCVASPSGNRTPVSRVTGGDTHHYTNEDGGDRPAARPPSGSRAACPRLPLPSTGRRPPRVPTQPRTKPTASVTAAARHPDRDPDPGALDPPQRAASCLQRGRSAGRRGREKASGAATTRWARAGRRRARRGAGGEGRPAQGPLGPRRERRRSQAPRPAAARRLRRPPLRTPARPPACLPACLAWRPARPAKGAGARAASGPSQASGHAPSQARPPPSPAPGRAEARSPAAGGKPSSLRRRSDFCPGNGLLALAALLPRLPPPALPPGRHPVLRARPAGPPALPSHSEAAEPPPCPLRGCRVPSTLVRRAILAGPQPACRPPGTRAIQPSCWPAHTGLPCTSPSREGCSAGEGAEALRARPAHPPAPGPRPRPRRHGARSRGKPLPRPEPSPPWRAPCLSAGSPRARSRSAKGPLLTTTTQSEPDPGSAVGQSAGARLTRLWVLGPERGSKDGMAGGGRWRRRSEASPSRARASRTDRARRPFPRPLSHAPPRHGRKASPPEGLWVGTRRSLRGTMARGRSDHAAPAPDRDPGAGQTASAPGALTRQRQGRGGRGRRRRRGTGRVGPRPVAPGSCESAAPRGPARARILSYRSPARRLLLQRGREMPTGEQ
nr:collagen alpha-1(I) chain-like [Ovis aries]